MPDNLIRLPLFMQELREDGYETPPYRLVREAALDGWIPAINRRGLWYAERGQKQALIAALGLRRRASSASHSTHRQSATAT